MLKVFETDINNAKSLAVSFNGNVLDGDRCFIMTENEEVLGMAVLRLVKAQVEISQILLKENLTFGHFDLLCRATLNAITFMKNINVYLGESVIGHEPYFKNFGFRQIEGRVKINSDDIKFPLCNKE